MAAFQPCKILFRSYKERIVIVHAKFRSRSRVDQVHAIAIERQSKHSKLSSQKMSMRSLDHFRHEWLARSKVSLGDGTTLSFQNVEDLVKKHKFCAERRLKDFYLYKN